MYKNIIKEICDELNIKLSFMSKGWLMKLECDGIYKYILGYKFDLNNQADSLIMDDKYAMYEVLNSNNIAVISHTLMSMYKDKSKFILDANTYFNDNKDIVFKLNNSTCGRGVYHITSNNELLDVINKVYKDNISVSLCPYYDIQNEYRCVYLDGEIKLIYAKEKPIVIGDGKRTLLELLKEFNPYYFNNHKLKDTFNYDYIPFKNEKIEYNWQFNLDKGARCDISLDNDLKKELSIIALECAKVINLTFGTIDIIKTTDNKLLVMEINSGVMMSNLINQLDDGYLIAKEIYKEAIKKMFKKTLQ